MTAAEVQLVLGLIPIAKQLIGKIGEAVQNDFDTENMSLQELRQKLEETAAENWPELEFKSSKRD
jgi:hypothetical protein